MQQIPTCVAEEMHTKVERNFSDEVNITMNKMRHKKIYTSEDRHLLPSKHI